MRLHVATIAIGDRYNSADSLAENEIHEWLLNIQKHDILKAETKDDYWEDIPQVLFELFKTNIQNKKYEYTMVEEHLWLEMEISLEPEPDEES